MLSVQITFAQQQDIAPEEFVDKASGVQFVFLDGGCYEMGCGTWATDCSGDEKPPHKVCVESFWIGKYEVTQEQWQKIMADNPSRFKKGGTYPVENISYSMAEEFTTRLSAENEKYQFSLPTEAEWEYAARSLGRHEKYAGGNNPDLVGFHRNNSNGSTHKVGSKMPNHLGLYDMSGNVWEWCRDWWSDDYADHPTDNPVGPATGNLKVIRGGAWSHNPSTLRTTGRAADLPDSENAYNGFRLIMREKK